jgi:hypothetical protein
MSPCTACDGDGRPKVIEGWLTTELERIRPFWPTNIPPQTTALVMSAGPWYNLHKGVMNAPAVYRDTLERISPFLGRLVKAGVVVIWLDVPPIVVSSTNSVYHTYGWDLFPIYNGLARDILTPHGVIFLNTSRALLARKVAQPSVSRDGLHWCNPAPDSAPSFIVQAVLHVLAKRVLSLKRREYERLKSLARNVAAAQATNASILNHAGPTQR